VVEVVVQNRTYCHDDTTRYISAEAERLAIARSTLSHACDERGRDDKMRESNHGYTALVRLGTQLLW
jgi:hypothetical protein